MVSKVWGCQRCGRDHEDLEFEELKNPADEWKFWAMCPLTNQPVLLCIVESPTSGSVYDKAAE